MTKNQGKQGVVEFIYFPRGPSDSSLRLIVINLGLAHRDAMPFFFPTLHWHPSNCHIPLGSNIHKQYPEGQTPVTMTLCGPPIVYWNRLCLAPRLGSGRKQSAFEQHGVPTSPILISSWGHTPSPGASTLSSLCCARPDPQNTFLSACSWAQLPQPRVPKSLEWLLLKTKPTLPQTVPWGFQPRVEKGNCLPTLPSVVPHLSS